MAAPHPVERLALAGAWTAVLALTAWSAWHRWALLTASPYPVGIDGYFYPIQVRSLLERGTLAYPSAPLTFWLMAPIAAVTDPVTAAKLVAAVVGALACVPAFLLGRRVGGLLGGVAAAVLIVTSGGSFYLSLEFVKNGVGLTLALTAVWLAARALERPEPGQIGLAVVALVATALAHKMAAVLAVVLVAPALVVELRARSVPRRVQRMLVMVGAAALVLAVVGGVVAPARFVGARDLAMLDDVLTRHAEWQLPALAIERPNQPPFRLWIGHQGAIVLAIVVLFGLGALLELAIRGRRPAPREGLTVLPAHPPSLLAGPAPPPVGRSVRPADDALAWAALALCVLAALPWLAVSDPQGLGFRLRVAAFAPAAIVLAAAVGRAVSMLAPPWRLIMVAPALTVWVLVRPAAPTDGLVNAHPAMVAATHALAGRLPADAVVITAERDLGFMAAYHARVPVRLRPEPVPPARRWRLIPLALIGLGSRLDQALTDARGADGVAPPIGLHPGHPNGLVLVPEATWEWVLARLPPKLAAHWREWHTI